MGKDVFVFPHTHWDREWYFTIEESQSLLRHDLDEILTHLEEHPDFTHFVLDGQSVMVDDYLLARPQDAGRLKAQAEAGRLRLGPWYTQTDSQVVGAESIVRNLIYGLAIARTCGPPMMVGYIPDSFGQTAAMPHILNGFGIDTAAFWRGKTERQAPEVNFLWTSVDGSKVQATNLPKGYWVSKYLMSSSEGLEKRVAETVAYLNANSVSDNVLLPFGQDQMPIQRDLVQMLAELEEQHPGNTYRIRTMEDYFASTFADESGYVTYEGEFTEGKYMRIHRSIYSTRMDIKIANATAENGLTRMLEPLLSLAHHLGFDYAPALVEESWKTILQCHAHDSIGCCNADLVNADIKHRFGRANKIISAHGELTLRLMAESITRDRATEDVLLVLNAVPTPVTRLVRTTIYTDTPEFALLDPQGNEIPYSILDEEDYDAQRLDRQLSDDSISIPISKGVITFESPSTGLGYTGYRIVTGRPGARVEVEHANGPILENARLRVEVSPTGIQVAEQDGQSVTLVFEESGDAGDNYDYSPPRQDLILDDFTFEAGEVTIAQGVRWIRFSAQREVPADLEERAAGATSGRTQLSGTVELRDSETFARIHLTHTNDVDGHRLRLKAVTSVHPEHSIADNHFGVIKRTLEDPEAADFQALGWSERPDSIFPMLGFAAITEGAAGAYVATLGLREYEVTGEEFNELAITLYRSVGDLGRSDLVRRPGRPSGILAPSPDSQLHQDLTFDLAVGFLAGESDILNASRTAALLNTPDALYQAKKYVDFRLNPSTRNIPAGLTWLSLDDSVVLSAVKLTEDGAGFAVRLFNPTWSAVDIPTPTIEGYVAHRSRLDETVGDVAGDRTPVPPCGSVTLVFQRD